MTWRNLRKRCGLGNPKCRLRNVGRLLAAWTLAVFACAAVATVTTRPQARDDVTLVRAIAAPTPKVVKYYVVKPPAAGQREYLYEIAVKTLGNGNRYPEIFGLNAGRTQPQGGRLTDPTQLQPGWILVLPDDAKGPDVQTGTVDSLFGSAASATASAVPTRTAGVPSVPAGRPATSQPVLLRFGALSLMVIFATLAAALIRGRRGRVHASPPSSPAPTPTPTAAPLIDLVPAVSATSSAPTPPAAAVTRLATEPPAGVPGSAVTSEFHTDVFTKADRVVVSLIGVRPGSGPAHAWCEPGQSPPPAVLPVIVGELDGRRLQLDLARAPDALTVVGALEACRRVALGLVGQLLAAGFDVTVVGDALGRSVPAGCRRLASLPITPDPGWDPDLPGVVVCAGPEAPVSARSLLASAGAVTVPVVLGEVPAARWSLAIAGQEIHRAQVGADASAARA